jgi:hypothetical protein
MDAENELQEPIGATTRSAAAAAADAPPHTRYGREVKPPERFGHTANVAMLVQGGSERQVPTSYKAAITGPDRNEWLKAMEEEHQSLQANTTWELAELPPGRKAIGSKWIFRIKEDAQGQVTRYKARLVAQGFTQQQGFDYEETFAPVMKLTTLRILVAVAAAKDYSIKQLDVSTAYLHSEVDEEIYMRQPPGFQVKGNKGQDLYCRLRRSIYGLKQAGRN